MRRAWPAIRNEHRARDPRLADWVGHTGVKLKMRRELVPALDALDAVMEHHGYRPRSGECYGHWYRTIRGGSKVSTHGLGVGIDFNAPANGMVRRHGGTKYRGPKVGKAAADHLRRHGWPDGTVTDMPAAMVADIMALQTVDGVPLWRSLGLMTGPTADAMHFQICATPEQLARGIDPTSLPSGVKLDGRPIPKAAPTKRPVTTDPTAPQSEPQRLDPLAMPTLRRGARGEAVSALQKELEDEGIEVGAIDGIFGRQTANAVRRAQRHHGLVPDGIVGPKTWGALLGS